MIPVGFKKSEGTLAASSLTFGGIVPRVEMTITGGRVTKVIGGGKYGDTLRRSFEEFKHLHGHYHDSNHRGERHWRAVRQLGNRAEYVCNRDHQCLRTTSRELVCECWKIGAKTTKGSPSAR